MNTICKNLMTITLAGLLTACAQPPASPIAADVPPPPSVAGECSASSAQFAVGQKADAALIEQARERSGARTVRVIGPGQAVTMDFSSQRLNLETDAAGQVTAARCG